MTQTLMNSLFGVELKTELEAEQEGRKEMEASQ